MDLVTSLTTIRDSLRTNLTDPYVTAGGSSRTWIHTDKPLSGARYPRIQIEKINNPNIPITIGPNYSEMEDVFINIWFYTQDGFKITVGGVEYKNELLVEKYMTDIGAALKSKFADKTLMNLGIKKYKKINSTPADYDPDTQLHFAALTIHITFFNVPS